jgi:hypothetical protein
VIIATYGHSGKRALSMRYNGEAPSVSLSHAS